MYQLSGKWGLGSPIVNTSHDLRGMTGGVTHGCYSSASRLRCNVSVATHETRVARSTKWRLRRCTGTGQAHHPAGALLSVDGEAPQHRPADHHRVCSQRQRLRTLRPSAQRTLSSMKSTHHQQQATQTSFAWPWTSRGERYFGVPGYVLAGSRSATSCGSCCNAALHVRRRGLRRHESPTCLGTAEALLWLLVSGTRHSLTDGAHVISQRRCTRQRAPLSDPPSARRCPAGCRRPRRWAPGGPQLRPHAAASPPPRARSPAAARRGCSASSRPRRPLSPAERPPAPGSPVQRITGGYLTVFPVSPRCTMR